MRLLVGMVAMVGCGRLSFDNRAAGGDAGAPDGMVDDSAVIVDGATDGVAAAPVSISSPPDGAQVQATATLTGACDTVQPLALSGAGLASPSTTTCTANAYSVVITFTPGAGTKTIDVTQTDTVGQMTTATHSFVRPALIVAYRTSANGVVVGQGIGVDCTLTVPRPAGIVDGDVLVATIYTDGGAGAGIMTAGWTRLALDGPAYVAMYRVAANEPTSYTFLITAGGLGGTCEAAGVIAAFSGGRPSAPIDDNSAGIASGMIIGAPGVTASAATLMVVAMGANGPATGIAPPSTTTTVASSRAATSWGAALIGWEMVPAGPTGSRTGTIATMEANAGALIVLNAGP